ncbi:hypothetical protein [Chryseobacterium fistulae]|nr:hypothetical protein [Chryseobacterium fistulae]
MVNFSRFYTLMKTLQKSGENFETLLIGINTKVGIPAFVFNN